MLLETLALQAFALKFPCTANGFGGLACTSLRRLFIMAPELHFAEYSLALHLLLQCLQGLIDIIIANDDLHLADLLLMNGVRRWQSDMPISPATSNMAKTDGKVSPVPAC
jgi:hypothetical protein